MSEVTPITWESLLATYNEFCEDNPVPTRLTCSNFFFLRLKNFLARQEVEDMLRTKRYIPPRPLPEIYGVEIVVDPDMKDNEWKFEYR